MMRDIPLDMQPYGMLLGSCRQPNVGVDKFFHTDNSDHIVVICNNNVRLFIIVLHIKKYFYVIIF